MVNRGEMVYLQTIFRKREIDFNTKLKVYNTITLPVEHMQMNPRDC